MKKEFPNIDGVWRSKQQGVTVTVTRKTITIDIVQADMHPKIIDVDNISSEEILGGERKRDITKDINKSIQFVNDIFWGPENK